MKHLLAAGASAFALLASQSLAASVVIDFEGFNAGDEITAGSLKNVASIFVDSNGNTDKLVAFDTNDAAAGEDPDLLSPFDNVGTPEVEQADLGILAVIADDAQLFPADDEGRGGVVTFNFDIPSILYSIDIADSGTSMIELFGKDGFLGSFGNSTSLDTNDQTFPNLFETILFGEDGTAGVTSMRISFMESGGFDNVTLETPLPGALPLMGGGMALLAAARRRRRNA